MAETARQGDVWLADFQEGRERPAVAVHEMN